MDIKEKTFNHALNMLKASGATYVVIDPEGRQHTHGDLEVSQKKRKRGASEFPHGTYVNLVTSQGLYKMNVGDVVVFDPQGARIESLRSTAISYAEKAWGNKSLATSVREGKVEALRIY
jgi:1-acyl-sn-glycerol-3-phosphate acyltransferase